MQKEKALVDKECLLKKYPGKGGWTYTEIPEIPQDKKAPFGWVTVKGKIDDYEFKHFKLMPMGNGQLFFSVKKEIRKKIGKEAGDYVRITLYRDNSSIDTPQEILDCFNTEPQKAYKNFIALSDGKRKTYLDWIYSAKTEETKVQRIAKLMEEMLQK